MQKGPLVTKGFSQIEGLDFDEIFSPVVWFESVWTILMLISTSSTMAEYITLSDCACNCAWYKIFFGELGKPMPFIPIYGDSHGAIFNAQNTVTLKGIKHIEIC